MTKRQDEEQLTRRDFLRRAALGAALTAGTLSGIGGRLPGVFAGTGRKRSGMEYRTLGRTKLKVSALGMGTIRTGNTAVIRRALDLGINYFDTAACYREGNGEIDLGKALKGRRDKAVVATKWHTNGDTPANELIASLDGSLRRLGMDHVDLIQIHGVDGPGQVESDEVWEAFTKLRKAGKVRFNGLSTHNSSPRLIEATVKTGWYDAVLPVHNALTAARSGRWVQAAHEAGMGLIAMKALAPVHKGRHKEAFKGLRGSPYQQAIQWLLKDPKVSTVIVDMPTFEELEEDYAAVTMGSSRAQLEEFEAAVAMIAAGTCQLCGACTGQCPAGVRVADIMRYALYHDGYGDRARAVALYRGLPGRTSAAGCSNCAQCQVVCPEGVEVRSELEKAHAVMA